MRGPQFDRIVPDNGYAWWYVDALSDDGQHALTIIAFIGSVFSPYYASQRRRAVTSAEQHCALNVALYGAKVRRWTMTERPATRLERSATALHIGPSSMNWTGTQLNIDLCERGAPVPSRVQGRLCVTLGSIYDDCVSLADQGAHTWRAIAPRARIEVDMTRPGIAWRGSAYVDSNWGDAPLEQAFKRWEWSRALLPDGSALVLYDITRRAQPSMSLALHFATDGTVTRGAAPPRSALPTTAWGIQRSSACDANRLPRVRREFENGPFYSRSLIDTSVQGATFAAVHESLDLDRFQRRWVQTLLPFRMPRCPW